MPAPVSTSSTGQPVVTFRFDSVGAREFGDVTKDNVGHRFAIVLDKQGDLRARDPANRSWAARARSPAISPPRAPTISRSCCAPARLPAPLKIIEERTVGAELGADSIKAGRYSAIGGLILVALFMIAALRPVRPFRRHRADAERGAAAGGADRCSAPR